MTFQSSTIVTDTDVEDAETTLTTLEKAESLKVDTERPDWLPEGVDSIDDLVSRYHELQQGVPSELDETDEDETDEDETDEDETYEDDQDADEAEGSAGVFDLNDLSTEYFENGSLSEDSYEQLEAAGIPRSYVDAYIQGYEARTALTEMQAAESVGGSENLTQILQWAGQALSDKEIDRINHLVASGDMDGYLTNLHGLKARYEAANGSLEAPALLGGNGGVSADIYNSAEEMKADMRDPRYAVDEAFRARVAAKVSRTRRAG